MQVKVVLYADSGVDRHERVVEVAPPATVDRLIELLKLTADRVVVVNGAVAGPGHTLQAGDEVMVFPALAGG